jgi:crossover junction endodeoxyribonuclease RuvC
MGAKSHRAYVGIDQSYSAYAIILFIEKPGAPAHREMLFDFSPSRASQGAARLRHIHRTLLDAFRQMEDAYDVRQVVMEGYAPGSKWNREALGELGAVTKLALDEVFGFTGRVRIAAPTALKKFVTGSGTAPKDLMLLSVYKKWGAEFSSNDLADAYGLMRIGHGLENGVSLRYEQEVIDALRNSQNM